ncbi:HEAT repeat domain-containing protein [Streptomyces sp. NPDC059009]|uniref:HEAT repeat domain-containing protein n=1 Tax=Streptomyces sp. NPDC059009 TaxID=3346694 RepID=UPI0036B093CE
MTDGRSEAETETEIATATATAEEEAAGWRALTEGPPPSKRLREMWAHGLARNPAAPADLRARLIGRSHHVMWRSLPSAVVDAALAHPEWKVRSLLADAQPNISPEQWARLILGEQDPRRRWIQTSVAVDRRTELTDAAYEELATDRSARVRAEAARLTGLPVRHITALAADTDPSVRASACRRAWPHLSASDRAALLDDPDDEVRGEALLRHHEEHPMPRSVFAAGTLNDRALKCCCLTPDLAEHVARHGSRAQRTSLALNPHLPGDLVALLAQDPDESVRFTISLRAGLTEDQRADIDIDFDPGVHHHALGWVVALHDDPAAMRRLAASSHPLVRRSVARARHLPPDVVTRLASDEDRVVQLFLAESCDDAPAAMLLRVWQWWTGSFSHPDRPLSHPNFPRHDLLRHADDPDPRMRRLALEDPQSTPELVERLSRDGDADVRHRAARDPRLTLTSAVRLLDDPKDRVRWAAAQHPHLPAHVVVQLLRDTETAQEAAGRPSLPLPVMEQLLRLVQEG